MNSPCAPAPGRPQGLAEALAGGDPRSLGRTQEVVDLVLHDPTRLGELFDCVIGSDVTVRMRAADALEKVCRQRPEWFASHVDTLLDELAEVDQPSVQWHLAQMLGEVDLTGTRRAKAVAILHRNLKHSSDWIVLNCSLEAFARFARDDPALREDFVALLTRHAASSRKSVAKRASKLLAEFAESSE